MGLARLFLLLVGGLLLAQPAAAARPASFDGSFVDRLVGRAISERSIAGATVTIAVEDRILLSRAYGATDPSGSTAVTSDMPFRLGSISKFFTALAVLRLVEEGRLSLDSPVAGLLVDRPAARDLPRTVTVRTLLNHTSGLGDRSGAELAAFIARDSTVRDSDLEPVLTMPLKAEPGSAWIYSNVGYRVLSWVIESVTGRRYGDYVREVLAPALGLSTLRMCDEEPRPLGFISREGVLGPDSSYAVLGLLGDGGLCAAGPDLARVPRLLLGGQFIGRGRLDSMVAPTTLAGGVIADYGLGVRRGMIGPNEFWGHSGSGLAGGWAALAYYPHERLTIAVLANGSGGAADAVTLQAKIAAAYFQLPPLIASALPPNIAQAVSGTFTDGTTTVCFADGPTGVTRRTAGSRQPPRPLLYQGNGIFGREDYPLDRLVFQIDGGRAVGHRVYYDGFFAELLFHVEEARC